MGPDDSGSGGHPPGEDGDRQDVREQLLRLLRLVAREVAACWRRRQDSSPGERSSEGSGESPEDE
jgi:hypothetical protein